MKAPPELRVDYVALDVVKEWPTNPKLHDLDTIKASMRRFGFTSPALVDEGTGRLIAGHGRLEALQSMRAAGELPPRNIRIIDGQWHMPIVRGNEFDSEEEAEKYLVADNRLVELGGWDPEALQTMLSTFEEVDLAVVGFSQRDLDKLAKMAAAAEPKEVKFTAKGEETVHECPACGHKFS